jgi:hypothetical protein
MSTAIPKVTGKMPPLEKTDYPSLSMDHSFSRTVVSIVGLEVQVYGLEEIRDSTKAIVALVCFPRHLDPLFLIILPPRGPSCERDQC